MAEFWFCCSCSQPNSFALAPDKCSICGHDRCANCVVEQTRWMAHTFEAPESAETTGVEGLTVADLLDTAVEYHEEVQMRESGGNADVVVMILGDISTGPVNMTYEHDTWACCQCGGTNAGWTSDFCPACGHSRCAYCG